MNEYIPLRRMIKTVRPKMDDPHLIMDTSSWRYRFTDPPRSVIVTSGVTFQLDKFVEIFPETAIRDLSSILDPRVEYPMVEPSDELLIICSNLNYKKINRRAKDTGWVDNEQISLAMNLARDGEESLILSNDVSLLGTVRELKKIPDLDFDKSLMSTISVRKHLEKKYHSILMQFGEEKRSAMFESIEKQYFIAA